MAKPRKRIRELLIGSLVVVSSFGLGWWAYERDRVKNLHVNFNFAQPFTASTRYEPLFIQSASGTAGHVAGDRLDILVEVDGVNEPLILDAVLTRQTKANLFLVVPPGGRSLVEYAEESGMRLKFRPTVTTTEPIKFERIAE